MSEVQNNKAQDKKRMVVLFHITTEHQNSTYPQGRNKVRKAVSEVGIVPEGVV